MSGGRSDTIDTTTNANPDIDIEQSQIFGIDLYSRDEDDIIRRITSLIESAQDIRAVDKDGKTMLHHAVLAGNANVAMYLIRKGIPIDAADLKGATPLFYALQLGYDKIFGKLIEGGAGINSIDINVSATGENGETLLHRAVLSKKTNIAAYFIKKGVQIDAVDSQGRTALHYALQYGCDEMVDRLIQNGANINAQDKHGKTPLHYCGEYCRLFSFGGLLKDDTNYEIADKYGNLSLHHAADGGLIEIVTGIIMNCPGIIDQTGGLNNDTALHRAAERGNLEIVRFLVGQQAEINSINRFFQTPLHSAVISRNVQMVRQLIDLGADVNSVDNTGRTPMSYAIDANDEILKEIIAKAGGREVRGMSKITSLHKAAREGNVSLARFEIDKYRALGRLDSLLKEADGFGKTFLHYAIENRQEEFIEALIRDESGVIDSVINFSDSQNIKPIHYAAQFGCLRVLELLYGKKPEPRNQIDHYGRVALHYAAKYGKVDSAQKIIELCGVEEVYVRDGYERTPLHYAAIYGNNEVASILKKKKVFSLSCKDFFGKTPLHYAAESGNYQLTEILLEDDYGKNLVSEQDHLGNIPIHLAAMKGRADIVDVLMNNCFNLNIHNVRRDTPLHLVVKHCKPDEAVVLIGKMCDKSANMDALDYGPSTALYTAVRRGEPQIVEALLKSGADALKKCRLGNPWSEAISIRNSLYEIDVSLDEVRKKYDLSKIEEIVRIIATHVHQEIPPVPQGEGYIAKAIKQSAPINITVGRRARLQEAAVSPDLTAAPSSAPKIDSASSVGRVDDQTPSIN